MGRGGNEKIDGIKKGHKWVARGEVLICACLCEAGLIKKKRSISKAGNRYLTFLTESRDWLK